MSSQNNISVTKIHLPMFKNTYQSGFISILFAGGSRPLGIWGQEVRNGHIRRVTDEDVQTLALEIMGTNVATTYIVCPAGKNQTLGIRLPFFIMIVKNMKKYFTFEITVLGSSYLETLRVQIHANVRIRRIYFSDRLYAEDEMPQEFKLYVPITSQKDKKVPKGKETKTTEDKGTGADKVRVSTTAEAEPKPEEKQVEPSGALPTPTESARAEDEIVVQPVEEEVVEAAPEEATETTETPLEEGQEPSEAAPVVEEDAEMLSPVTEGEEVTQDATPAEETPATDEVPPSDAEAEEAVPDEIPPEEPPAEAEAPPAEVE